MLFATFIHREIHNRKINKYSNHNLTIFDQDHRFPFVIHHSFIIVFLTFNKFSIVKNKIIPIEKLYVYYVDVYLNQNTQLNVHFSILNFLHFILE